MEFNQVAELTPAREDWAVQARLCRMWEAINFRKNNSVMGLELLLLDAQGHSIQAFVRPHLMKKYARFLEEGEIHSIKNFRVEQSAIHYKVAPTEYRILFNALTSVRKVGKSAPAIPRHIFFFVAHEVHTQRINDHRILTDIIGKVSGVGPLDHLDSEKKTLKRQIELSTDRTGPVMRLTLWGKLAELFDGPDYVDAAKPVIAVATSTAIKLFDGELGFSSTTATMMYFNPTTPETEELKLRFAGVDHFVRSLDNQSTNKLSRAEQMSLNRKTIPEILQMVWVPGKQERLFTVLATIKGIDNKFGWSYISCPCKKKVTESNGSFFCPSCNKDCTYPSAKYKLTVEVEDGTGSETTFVLFDEEAEKLIRHPARKFVDELGAHSNKVPKEMIDLIGRTYVFRIKLTDYNLKDGFENYTVNKIFETDQPAPPKSHALKQPVDEGVGEKRKAGKLGSNVEAAAGPKKSHAPCAVVCPETEAGGSQTLITPEKKERKPLITRQ